MCDWGGGPNEVQNGGYADPALLADTPSVEPAGLADALDEIGRLRLMLDSLAVEQGSEFGRGYAAGFSSAAPLDVERLIAELESFMEPMGTESAVYFKGKRAGLRLAIGLVREAGLPTQASDSPEKP